MDKSNLTLEGGFVLLGFSDVSPQLQILLSVMFIFIYFISMIGNLMIFLLLTVDPVLHTPMYFFLRNLSIVDICLASVTIPKTVSGLLSEDRHISFSGCVAQMFSFIVFGVTDCILLAAMSLDRYVAICIPLRYTTIMSKPVCVHLASGSWIIATACSLSLTPVTFTLPFCKSHEIHHFFCDLASLTKLACGDSNMAEVVTAALSVLVLIMPFLLIVVTYTFIVSKILKIRSSEGRQRAASTCASHMVSVLLLYGTTILTYSKSKSSYSMDRVFSVCYAFLTPMLNPLIYSLRNKDVKEAFKKQRMMTILSR
ncbi:olfactory receptor 5V1-like [Lissotriton helveticus]